MIAIGIIFDITQLYLRHRRNRKEKSITKTPHLKSYDNEGGTFGGSKDNAIKYFVGKWRPTVPIGEGVDMGGTGWNGFKDSGATNTTNGEHLGVSCTETTAYNHRKEGGVSTIFYFLCEDIKT